MDPFTIGAIIAAIVGGAAVIALLSWSRVQTEIDAAKIPGGFAKVINKGLKGSAYEVNIGIFNNRGVKQTSKTLKAKSLDSDLQSRFARTGGEIRVQT